MAKTSIEWTESVWNPVRGCSRVSEGCRNCYAERQAARFSGKGQPYEGLVKTGHRIQERRFASGAYEFTKVPARPRWTGEVRFIPEQLEVPLRWRKSRRVFVNSMSDLFHEGVTDEQIAAVFGVMAACPQHRFQLLTKRPKRMLEWFEWMVSLGISAHRKCIRAALDVATTIPGGVGNAYMNRAWEKAQWPLPNVDLYVSIEDQATADERIPLLLQTPAAVRGVSAEPLLASIDFGRWVFDRNAAIRRSMSGPAALNREQADASIAYPLDHVIVGGESGPSARPCNVEWIRSIVNQCQAAGVACFVKQLGANYVDARNGVGGYQSRPDPLVVPTIRHLKHRKGGDMSEWPEDLRVREYPEVAR